MSTVSLSGNDIVNLNNRVFSDFADGDVADLKYPNDIAGVKTGKNGNTLYVLNETGKQAEFMLRLIRGSSDDKFLNSLLASQQANFAGFPLMIGEFVKRIGDGKGVVTNDTYILGGGVFTKQPEAKSNVEGDTNASVIIYTFKFSNVPRGLS